LYRLRSRLDRQHHDPLKEKFAPSVDYLLVVASKGDFGDLSSLH
jgi:hypothetical protein